MKKTITIMVCTVLFAMLIPAYQALAEEETDSGSVEEEYVYTGLGNKVKKRDEELAQKYQQGITMEPEQIEARKALTEELGLEEYVDDRYFLTKEYYHQYSIDELEKKGLILLVECMTEEELEVWEYHMKSGIAPRYIKTGNDVLAWTDTTGATVRTHVFDVDGHIAFCGDHYKTAPASGNAHSEYIKVTDSKIIKFLYYGYGGPEDKMTALGYSRAKSYCLMAFSIDKLRKGERLGTSGTVFWNEIKDLPNPTKGAAYYVDTYDDSLQDLFFYAMPQKGKLQIHKLSANPKLTEGNSCYLLSQAEYGVYTNANGVSGQVATLKTANNGSSQEIEVDAGTYYVKELKAPKGFALDAAIHKVAVEADNKKDLQLKEQPQSNPLEMLLIKKDADSGQSKPQGSATLAGAQFTVKFYGGLWEKGKDPAVLGEKALRTWVFQTDANGNCYYNNSYKLSGDTLFQTSDGTCALPLGTITIQEKKASEGYQINPNIYILQIISEGTGETVHTYQQQIIPEKILKLDLVKKQEKTKTAIAGAEFLHTKPDGKTEVMKTDTNGTLVFKGLQYGNHQLRELSVMDGYQINGNIIRFNVAADNRISLQSEIQPQEGNVKFEVTKEGNIYVEMEDRLSLFTLLVHKINDKKMPLDDAEFTLYAEKECRTKIAEKATKNGGLLQIGDLEIGKKYYLKETKAPQGYRLLTDAYGKPVVYEIYTESIPMQDKFVFYVDGKAYTVDSDKNGAFTIAGTKADREVHMTLENKIGRRLPNTGSSLTIRLILAGIVCFVSSVCLGRKKKRSRYNRLLPLIAVISVMSLTPTKVMAADAEAGKTDFGRGEAAITITGNTDQSLIGKKFHIYQLFHAENAVGGESINYTFHKKFAAVLQKVVGKRLGKTPADVTEYEVIDYIQTLNSKPTEGARTEQTPEGAYSELRYFIEEVRDEIVREKINGETVNVTSVRDVNSFVVSGLEYGYYIVDEVSLAAGTHAAASLCMVNTANPQAGIHVKSDYPTVSKKIREDDNRKEVGEDGWNDMADFEIGQRVPYQFISNVPDINGYDSYYYAWHDRMDEALTFQPETVSISVHNGDLGNEYTLSKEEYSVITNTDDEESFKVEIKDLKAIIDREFNRKNELKENIYGQEVCLRYDALLNDKAAEKTGRPGFENDVKLEFSNNPDGDGKGQTGETPWDSVVCFTYRLNGLKMNDHNLELEGAVFRLYADEKCEQEVYVKKTADGYHVINRDSVNGNDHEGGEKPLEAVEIISGKDGTFNIIGLDGGTYWLKETKAPAGYRPLLDAVKVEVIPTFVKNRDFYVKGDGATEKALRKLEFAADIRQFFEGMYEEHRIALEADSDEGSGNLTVINKVGLKLPQSGSSMMLLLAGAGMGLVIVAIIRKRKDEKSE